MVKIRLTRVGKKNKPYYRIVVCEHTKPVKGKFIEIVGSYDPHQEDKKGLVFKKDRIDYWVGNGAQMSDTVASLINPTAKKAKVKTKSEGKDNKKKESQKAQKKADNTEKDKAKKEDKAKEEVKDNGAK